MDAFEVIGNIKCRPWATLPTTESQARELTSLKPEEQIQVWEQVNEQS